MRRYFLGGLGTIEVAIAIAIVVIGMRLPSRHDVSTQFGRVEKVTDGSEKQVRLMREQVIDLRRQDLGSKADQLRGAGPCVAGWRGSRRRRRRSPSPVARP